MFPNWPQFPVPVRTNPQDSDWKLTPKVSVDAPLDSPGAFVLSRTVSHPKAGVIRLWVSVPKPLSFRKIFSAKKILDDSVHCEVRRMACEVYHLKLSAESELDAHYYTSL